MSTPSGTTPWPGSPSSRCAGSRSSRCRRPTRPAGSAPGNGAMVTLTGVLGRLIEPEGRGRDVLQFPVGEPEGSRPVGGFSVSRPAFRGASRTESGWLAVELDGLHLMIRPVQDAEGASEAPDEPAA